LPHSPLSSKTIACAIVGSRLDYANSVLTGISAHNIHRLQASARSKFLGACSNSLNNQLHLALNSLHWLLIRQRIDYKLATIVHLSLHNACPQYLSSLLHTYTPTRQLRSASLNLLSQPRAKIALTSRGFWHIGPSIWNSLPPHLSLQIQSQNSLVLFCKHFWPLTTPIQQNHFHIRSLKSGRLPPSVQTNVFSRHFAATWRMIPRLAKSQQKTVPCPVWQLSGMAIVTKLSSSCQLQ